MLPKIKVEPTKDAKEVFDKEEYKPKQSPGHFPIKQVTLPKAFLEGAEKMITGEIICNWKVLMILLTGCLIY